MLLTGNIEKYFVNKNGSKFFNMPPLIDISQLLLQVVWKIGQWRIWHIHLMDVERCIFLKKWVGLIRCRKCPGAIGVRWAQMVSHSWLPSKNLVFDHVLHYFLALSSFLFGLKPLTTEFSKWANRLV